MSDYDDRGAYTPPSDRLAFDARQPVRGGGPAPVTLIVSGLVLIGLVGGVFFLYRDGFRHRGVPALVGAPADVRTPAPAAAGPPTGLTVDKTASAAPAPAFGPPPSQALPPAAAHPTLAAAPTTSSALPPAAPAAAASAPAKSAPPQVVMFSPNAPPSAPRKAAAAQPPTLAIEPRKEVAVAAPPRKAAAAPRLATHRAAPMTIASLADAAIAERARGERATHALNAHDAARIAAPSMEGATGWVQIGAFSSAALANQSWRDLARIEPAAMAGKGRAVQPFTRDDGAILYRAYVTGFASVSAAQAFCSELRSAGKGCIVK